MQLTSPDSLLQEIDDDLARKRMEALWKKYGPYVVAGAFAVIAATAAVTAWKTHVIEARQSMTKALIDIVDANFKTPDERIGALLSVAWTHADRPVAALARLEAASRAFEADKREEGISLLEAVVTDDKMPKAYRQLAALLSVQARLDDGDIAALESRLAPLMEDESVWRFSAREMAAYLALRQGDRAKARGLFAALKAMPGIPDSMLPRVKDAEQWVAEGMEKP